MNIKKAKYEDLRKWEQQLVLRCHIAGKLKYNYEEDHEGEMLPTDDGTIMWAYNTYDADGDGPYPGTVGFPDNWFKCYKRNGNSEYRELSEYAKKELAEQQEAIEQYEKRQERLKKDIDVGRAKIRAAKKHAQYMLDEIEQRTKNSLAQIAGEAKSLHNKLNEIEV